MTKNKKHVCFLTIILGFLVIALPASAAVLPFCTYTGNCQTCDFAELFINLANYGFSIIGGVALLMFVIGGVFLVMGGANTERLTRGKQVITAAIVGMVIVLCAYLIVNFVVTALAGSENIQLSKDDQPWYQAPGCKKVSAGDVEKANECQPKKNIYLKNPTNPAAKTEYDKCSSIFSTVRDGAPCKPCPENVKPDINCVIQEQKGSEGVTGFKCVSECTFLTQAVKRVYEGYKCEKTDGWNDEQKASYTCETGLCPGSTTYLCCKQKPQ